MGIDVLNHIWVGVFSCEFVRQFGESYRLRSEPPVDSKSLDRFREEAETLADLALETYRRAYPDTDRPHE